jgi:hypothetical protein
MANDLYPSARSAFLAGTLAWTGGTVTVALLDASYTYSAAHDMANDLTGVLATEALTGRTILTGGVADGDDISVSGVGIGDIVERIVIYKDTGTPSTSALIAFMDTNDDSTPIYRVGDGAAIGVPWSSGADRIFRL